MPELGTEPVWGRAAVASEAGPLPDAVDAVVVGAGITGIAAAIWLQRAGKSVVVLERGGVGAGASGRNAGFLLVGVADNYADAVRTYGNSVAHEVWEFTAENHALVCELAGDLDAIDYRHSGSLTVAAYSAEAARLEESAVLLRAAGIDAQWLPHEGSHGALLNPGDGCVHPVRLLEALVARHGIRVYTGVTVSGVQAGAPAGVETDRGTVRTDVAVLATNAWTAQLFAGVPVRPVRAQMLATAPLGRTITKRPVYAEHGYRYWNQLPDGRLVYGGCRNRDLAAEDTDSMLPSETIQGSLDRHIEELDVTPGEVTHRWAGTMGFSPDGLPLAGQLAEGVWTACGYTGHGMGFAVNSSRHLVNAVARGEALPGWLDLARVGMRTE